jgi:hypothetical protein
LQGQGRGAEVPQTEACDALSRSRPSWKDDDDQDLFAKDVGKGFYENGLCWTVESTLGKHPRNHRDVVKGLRWARMPKGDAACISKRLKE